MNGQLKYQQLIESLEKSNYLKFYHTDGHIKGAVLKDLEIPPSPEDNYFKNYPEWPSSLHNQMAALLPSKTLIWQLFKRAIPVPTVHFI